MRVYGASPLYNYVELIFRSKRLFIISVVLATAIVSSLASLRAKSYSATALVLLTGSQQAALQGADEAQMGSIRYKLNVLTLVLKDPAFFEEAMRAGGLNKNHGVTMSAVEFDKFCKDVKQAMTYAANESILEISIHWEDDRAAPIVKAFYDAYADRVVTQESVTSIAQTELLQGLVADYTRRQQDMEQKVLKFKREQGDQALGGDPTTDVSPYSQEMRSLEEKKLQLSMAQQKIQEYQKQLATTPQTLEVETVSGNPDSAPAVKSLLQKKTDAEANLADLRKRYQDTHPKVREALDQVAAASAEYEKASKDTKKTGYIEKHTQALNPQYQRLKSIVDEQSAQVRGMQAEIALATKNAEEDKARSNSAGQIQYQYKWMTDKYQLISQIRTNLQTRLENADLEAKRDQKMHAAEMKLQVPPTSEPESTGVRSLMIYAAGPILGLIIAFAFSLIAESLDHSLRTPVEVEKYLNKPVLAVLPRMDPPKPSNRKISGPDASRASLPPV